MIVGIDISKDTFDASWVVSGKEISKKYDYTELGLKSFSNDTPKEALFLMEATGVARRNDVAISLGVMVLFEIIFSHSCY